jgi:hypothetical protein
MYNNVEWADIRKQADIEEERRVCFLPESRAHERTDEANAWNKWFVHIPYYDVSLSLRISRFLNHKLRVCSICEITKKEEPGLIVTGCSVDVKKNAIQSAAQCGVAFMDANSLLIMALGFGEQIAAIADMFGHASTIQPVILYIDHLDTFLPRSPQRDNYADVRVSSCLDHLDNSTGTAFPVGIFVMGVTDVLINVEPQIVSLLQLAIS